MIRYLATAVLGLSLAAQIPATAQARDGERFVVGLLTGALAVAILKQDTRRHAGLDRYVIHQGTRARRDVPIVRHDYHPRYTHAHRRHTERTRTETYRHRDRDRSYRHLTYRDKRWDKRAEKRARKNERRREARIRERNQRRWADRQDRREFRRDFRRDRYEYNR